MEELGVASRVTTPVFAMLCTLCHSDVAGQVRATLALDPVVDAALTLAPAPAIVALWWWITRGR